MTHQITFHPSGKSCPVEANETVLQATLRAGLSPDYGCSNGNCGQCRATLRAGEIDQTRHHDHALSDADKASGAFLMCSYRALGDIEIEADLTQGPEDIPTQQIDTKVKAIEHLDPQVINLHLQTPRSQRLRFISGQSVALETADGAQTRIAIASCPCDDRNLYFHIPDIPGDPFSEAVFSGTLKTRSAVRLTGPIADAFYLDQSDTRPSIILSWHTGFAPIISLMEHALSLEVEQPIHLYRFSPTPSHQYLPHLCRSWADAFDNIDAQMMPDRLTLLSEARDCASVFTPIADSFPDIAHHNIYVAGPPNFVEAAHSVFGARGVPPAQLKTHTDWAGVLD